ncbi:hypothetical protein K443DRAFT_9835 [Laccaria amethystina LaAM-08-1]|uniref:Uncharacterized protein n=1 Tax=Laccaria amethystina LaAM-08-1 TaxID=1095629 RepID=A0A0C9WLS4_9AGAR|nr:hypothetical protein K443DRAFT_9835 [Laccaria amethystina LaAM-08-1]
MLRVFELVAKMLPHPVTPIQSLGDQTVVMPVIQRDEAGTPHAHYSPKAKLTTQRHQAMLYHKVGFPLWTPNSRESQFISVLPTE